MMTKKSENPKFVVFAQYASDSLRRIFLSLNFSNFVEWDGTKEIIKGKIPLLLCEDREILKRKGIMCPYEFVVERRDLLQLVDSRDGSLLGDYREILKDRLNVLEKLYSKNDLNFTTALRNWFAGRFRMYLMLDATTHGTARYIDLDLVKKGKDNIINALANGSDGNEFAQKLKNRILNKCDPEFDDFHELARTLYDAYFLNEARSIYAVLCDTKLEPNDRKDRLGKIYTDSNWSIEEGKVKPCSHKDRLPLSFGDRAKYVTPSGKLNMLLIDDNDGASPFSHLENKKVPDDFKSSISQDDWVLLHEIFNVNIVPVNNDNAKNCNVYEEVVRKFRDFHEKGWTYDLILIDLCLGNCHQSEDLEGYAMIRIAKVFFPGTPIVVYSRFGDMEHISRAFFNGAKWFLVKGEEAKLPRHVLKMLRQVGWHREWNSIEHGANPPVWIGDRESSFFRKFCRTREWKYLTYKSLEYFPGNFIAVKKMGGGISSAVTFKAVKGVKLGDEYLQSPSIIKIDTSYNTMIEFERYFRMIRPYMANEAGRVEKPERVLNREYSSIVYTFAGKQDKAHELDSMGNMLDDDVKCLTACDYEKYRYALTCIFDEILPKIHRVSPELELGDIRKPDVLPTDIKDAFDWRADPARKTSFPNVYFGEFQPSEFWKSYMLRMQPWARISIKFESKWPFENQPLKSDDTSKRLTFHNVMLDPFKKNGRWIIEAYTSDKKLLWLDGKPCDFVARFRKRISPGTSLWFNNASWSKNNGELKNDFRLEWLKETFLRNKGKRQADFTESIGVLMGFSKGWNKGGRKHDDLDYFVKLQDAVTEIARKVSEGDNAKMWKMKCPVGIVHGDLNLKNIMLESRRHAPLTDDPDVTKTVSDVWLIDFARTRRDVIAHDFNVFFTSTLGELFVEDLIGRDEPSSWDNKNWTALTNVFKDIIVSTVAPTNKAAKGVPDTIKDNERFVLIYRILRRTYDAAIHAGISQNMYLLTTALACLYTLKIFLNNGCKVRLAAGYFSVAWICYDLICQSIGYENEMRKYKRRGMASE